VSWQDEFALQWTEIAAFKAAALRQKRPSGVGDLHKSAPSKASCCASSGFKRLQLVSMPTGQITKNCHYISRSLTRPWEAEQRRLHFYDFDAGRWYDDSSYGLFAEESLNPQHVEAWLDKTIEGPLSLCRKKLTSGASGALEDWGFYRAATLMLWLQGMRVKSVSDLDARRNLEHLATRSIEETDQLVVTIREEYDLALATTVGKDGMLAPLYFPSSGLFPLTYPDSGCISGHTVALGLPLDLWSALIALPRENTGVRDASRIPSSISNLSVGVANADKVVVPPLLLEQRPRAEVTQILKELRAANAHLLDLVKDSKRLVAAAFEQTGLEPPRDGAGRFPPRPRN
jgi:hypothetical protein